MKYLFISIFLILTSVISVADSAKTDVIVPLTIGNYWIYEQITYDENNTPIETDTIQLSITASVDDRNETLYYYTWQDINWLSDLVTNSEKGLMIYGQASLSTINLYNSPNLWIKYPCEKGDTFYDPKNGIDYEVTDKLEVNVPAGNFMCIEYSARNKLQESVMRLYFSPGIGYVKGLWEENKQEQRLIKSAIIRNQ